MEILLGIISGFLLGVLVSPFLINKWQNNHHEIEFMKEARRTAKFHEEAGIFHPIPPMVKREQQKTEEARSRGEDGVPLDQI